MSKSAVSGWLFLLYFSEVGGGLLIGYLTQRLFNGRVHPTWVGLLGAWLLAIGSLWFAPSQAAHLAMFCLAIPSLLLVINLRSY